MPTPEQPDVDCHDEREMFSALYPLVAAYPTPEAIAATMPLTHPYRDPCVIRREVGSPPPHHALRRLTPNEWSAATALIVQVPDELLGAHADEVSDVLACPPQISRVSARRYALAPIEEYRAATLGILHNRIGVGPATWATAVMHLDERSMILLAEHTSDWSPWVPMILFAGRLRALDEHDRVLRAAEHRLLLVARRLLDALGFTAVRVADTLGNAPAMQGAVQSLFRKEPTPA